MRFTLLAASLVLVCAKSFAGVPEELDSARAHFKEAEVAVAAAKASTAKATEALRGCRNGMLQLQFAGSVDRLEKVRKSLEAGRRDAQTYRAELEGQRQRIEASNHGAGRDEYARRMGSDYAVPLGQELVPLLETYAQGIEGWSAIFVKYGAFCAQPGYTTAKGAEFVASTGAELDALSQKTAALISSASAARSSITGAVASAPRHQRHHAGRR